MLKILSVHYVFCAYFMLQNIKSALLLPYIVCIDYGNGNVHKLMLVVIPINCYLYICCVISNPYNMCYQCSLKFMLIELAVFYIKQCCVKFIVISASYVNISMISLHLQCSVYPVLAGNVLDIYLSTMALVCYVQSLNGYSFAVYT